MSAPDTDAASTASVPAGGMAPSVHGAAVADGKGVPSTPVNVPRSGAPVNPSVASLAARFGSAVVRTEVIWGETTVWIARSAIHDVVRWLHDDPGECYDYLVDVTAVEYRESQRPLEVVWHLRALERRRFLRLKVELLKSEPLEIPSVTDVYSAADWLERECYDMFGITFTGHGDLRRILLWERYREGYPLRKDFPLRGRFSRSEQLKQVLSEDPEARYSLEELSIADAFDSLPEDMKRRLAQRSAKGDEREGE